MEPTNRRHIDALRLSILIGLGLPACGPGSASSATTASGTSGTSGGSTSDTSAAPSTGSGATSEPTTGGGSGSGAASTASSSTSAGTSGSATATTATTDATTGAADRCTPAECEAPEAIPQQFAPDTPSGFVRCASGLIHRVEAVACAVPMAPGDCARQGSACTSDGECTERPFGACVNTTCGPRPTCDCEYGCGSDADCLAGQICLCAIEGLNDRPRCVDAGCITDAECGGQSCSPSLDATGTVVDRLACHGEGDTCCGANDCSAGAPLCEAFGDHWTCIGLSDCGRPLVVDGRGELAAVARRTDWRAGLAAVEVPAGPQRRRVAAHWARAGLAEHASVASFARFILQLLALGAPPALIEAAQRALADEVRHAQLCFALASAFAGEELGPAALPAACAPLAADREAVVLAAIDEACVGETLSALEVCAAAEHAVDPHLRALLRSIADDEARHAVLGWTFVRWALTGADEGLRRRATERFARALTNAAPPERGDQDGPEAAAEAATLRRFGVVDGAARARLIRRGLAEVVAPCAAALLAA